MKTLISLFLFLFLFGCGPSPELKSKRIEKRQEVFKECLTMASQIHRVSDDDVSDIISECSSYSYYISSNTD